MTQLSDFCQFQTRKAEVGSFTRIYTVYAALCSILVFLLFYPVFYISAQRVAWHSIALNANRWWTRVFLTLIFIRKKRDWRFKPEKGRQYLVCANHFSYLDIPSLSLLPISVKFIGKSSLGKIPLFGYMYRKIHITVDRSSIKSRAESLLKAREAVDEGFNVAFFPEGGMKSTNPPQMVPFLDGVFRLAVERQLPIVPVILPDNYKIMPNSDNPSMHLHTMRIIMLEPVIPHSTEEKEVDRLRNEVYRIMERELSNK